MPSSIVLDTLSPDGLALLEAAAAHGITYEVATGLSGDALAVLFKSAVKTLQDGSTAVRVKLALPTNKHPARFWAPGAKAIGMPPDLSGAAVLPMVRAAHVWMNGSGVGIMWEATDYFSLSTRPAPVCPWVV